MPQRLAPTQASQRFISMDLMRGIAVLGILLMNITSFSHVFAYYVNPYLYGEPSSSDFITWAWLHFFADQKFYTLFSLLFGAGIMLLHQKSSPSAGNLSTLSNKQLHYRRNIILLVVGLIHAIGIWFGDILIAYAVSALWLWFFANSHPSTKIYIGISLILVLISFYGLSYLALTQLSDYEVHDFLAQFYPDPEAIYQETKPYLSNYGAQFDARLASFADDQLFSLLTFAPFRLGGTMLIGMALYQQGIITGARSTAFYSQQFLLFFALGSALTILDFYQLSQADFSGMALFLSSSIINDLASLFMGISYVMLFALWSKSRWMLWLQQAFANAGRMAFTLYLSQSLICTFIFYRFATTDELTIGLGLFGQLDRLSLLLIACGIFTAQMGFAHFWLKRYRFGPLEWAWRSLSYKQLQPMKKQSH